MTQRGFDRKPAAVGAGDAEGHGEPEASAFAVALRGEERIEDAFLDAGRNSVAGVVDGDDVVVAGSKAGRRPGIRRLDVGGFDAERDLATVGHCVAGVHDEVQEHLLEGGAVSPGRDRGRRRGDFELDARGEQGSGEGRRFGNDTGEVDNVGLVDLGAGEGEEAADEVGTALGSELGLAHVLGGEGVVAEKWTEEVEVADDDGKQVVEVVGDTAGEVAETLELLALANEDFELTFLALELDAVGDVPEDESDAGWEAGRVEDVGGLDLDGERGTVLAEAGKGEDLLAFWRR